jgi:hypothetical protein
VRWPAFTVLISPVPLTKLVLLPDEDDSEPAVQPVNASANATAPAAPAEAPVKRLTARAAVLM